MSNLDIRKDPEYSRAIARIPHVKLRPLVGASELKEIAHITDVIPKLAFPINSAGELLDQLGEDKTLSVLGVDVDPVRMIKYMPAYYFPLASYENFVEKLAKLIIDNRRKIDTSKYIEKIKEKMQGVTFPIEKPEDLDKILRNTTHFNVAGRKMDTSRTISELQQDFFPIKDLEDLEIKAIHYLTSRPLIEKD